MEMSWKCFWSTPPCLNTIISVFSVFCYCSWALASTASQRSLEKARMRREQRPRVWVSVSCLSGSLLSAPPTQRRNKHSYFVAKLLKDKGWIHWPCISACQTITIRHWSVLERLKNSVTGAGNCCLDAWKTLGRQEMSFWLSTLSWLTPAVLNAQLFQGYIWDWFIGEAYPFGTSAVMDYFVSRKPSEMNG